MEDRDIRRLGGLYNQVTRWGVYDKGGIAPTVTAAMGMGGGHVPMIAETIPEGSYKYMEIKKVDRNYEILPQTVRVRKYPIDQKTLAEVLRLHKTISNKEIADVLNIPVTKVEYWFRTDSCGAVVDENCWYALKDLLGGGEDLDAFDEAVMTFEERDGVFEKSERVYMPDRESPTITTQEDIKTIDIKVIGKMDHTMDHTFESANRVYGSDGVCPTLPTQCGGGHMPKIIDCVAMRGRNPENPSDRTPGIETEQRLEVRPDGCSNTITTVQKDNLVLVRQATKEGSIPCEVGGVCDLNYPDSKTRRGRVQGNGQICPTLTTENIPSVLEEWTWEIDGEIYLIRIRKLTPRECWRLMGFTDEDFDKAQEVNSNTQLYKQAGNSIVVPVLEGIFRQLIEGS